jgi:hypothetical protein
MDQDRSLKDLVRFLDPSGDMSDADIAKVTQSMKFTDVLDVITHVSKGNDTDARAILTKYDDRFTVAQEYAGAAATSQSTFKPIKPVGSSPTLARPPTNPNGTSDEEDIDAMVNDPQNKNKPEVRQIQSLLQRMQR